MPEPAPAAPAATEAAPPAAVSPLLMGPDGEVYRVVDPQKAANAIASGQYRPLSPEEQERHQVEREEAAKGVVGSLKAAGSSAINQLFFGVPGAVAEHLATPEERHHQELVDEYHQTARLLGGAAGVGGSLLIGGEFFRGAELAGEAVEHGILPAARVAEAGLAHKLAATAANFATQGAILASPEALTHAAFGDPQKAAEILLWGVGAGAALGAGGELFSSGREAVREGFEALRGQPQIKAALDAFGNERTLKAVGANTSQLNRYSKEQLSGLADFAHEEGLIRPGMTRGEVGDAVRAAGDKWGKVIGDTVDSLDGELGKGAALEHAIKPGQIGDGLRAALDGPELRMPMNADQAKALDLIVESAHKLPTTEVDGQQVVSFKDAQDFVSSLRRRWVDSISRAQSEGGARGIETVTPLDEMKSAAYQVARDTLHKAADAFAPAAGKPELVGQLAKAKQAYWNLAQLEKFAATYDRQAAGNRLLGLTDFLHMGQGPASSLTRAAGAGIGGLLAGTPGAMIGAHLGAIPGMALDVAGKHLFENQGLVALAALAKRAGGELPEHILPAIGETGARSLAAAGTYGLYSAQGTSPEGTTAPVLDQLAEHWSDPYRGLPVLSAVAQRAAKEGPVAFSATVGMEGQARLGAAMRAVQDTVKQLAIRGMVAAQDRGQKHMTALLGSTSGLTPDQSHAKLGARLTALASNPEAAASVTGALSGPFAQAAPQVGDAYQQKLLATIQYLYAALPKAPAPPAPFAPQTWQPTASERLAFHDKAEIIANPMSAMRHVAQGTLSPAHLDALRTIYPLVYGMMGQQILEFHAAHPDVLLPMPERQSVATFLGTPLGTLDSPDKLRALQSSWAPAASSNGPPGAPPPRMAKGKFEDRPKSGTTFGATMSARAA